MHVDYSLNLPSGPDYLGVLSYNEMAKIVGDLIEELKKPDPSADLCWRRRFTGFEWSINTGSLHITNSLYPCEDVEISITRRIVAMTLAQGEHHRRPPEEISYAYDRKRWFCKRAFEPERSLRDLSAEDYSFILNFILEAFYFINLRKKKAKEINEKVHSILYSDYGWV